MELLSAISEAGMLRPGAAVLLIRFATRGPPRGVLSDLLETEGTRNGTKTRSGQIVGSLGRRDCSTIGIYF